MTKIYVYGTVGYDIDADYMRIALDESEGEVELRINSGGGDVFEGNAIYSLLESYKSKEGNSVKVYVDGIAASIASVIAMAGDDIRMSSNALMMIHNPWMPSATGGADDLRDMANVLDKIRETILTVYHSRTGIDRDTIASMMDEETWLSAEEAFNFGFSDGIISASEEPVASIKAFNYANAPVWLKGMSTLKKRQANDRVEYIKRSQAKAKIATTRCCNKKNNVL